MANEEMMEPEHCVFVLQPDSVRRPTNTTRINRDSMSPIRQDVFWQNSEPVDLSMDYTPSSQFDQTTQDLFSELLDGLNTDQISHSLNSKFDPSLDLRDNRSSTSEDSNESMSSIEESYMSSRKQKPSISKGSSRRKIDPVYCNDPYLQRHRLMVNARQKNRMMKLNNMYTLLNDTIPSNIPCEITMKPQSKLGILRRAISYLNSLQETLGQTSELCELSDQPSKKSKLLNGSCSR